MDILLKIVRSNELLEIRSKVLRNNTSHENCKFNGDNKKSSVHIGAYRNDQIVGGISIIKNNCNYKELKNCYQLRGMCVLDNFQNNGIGNKILNEAEKQSVFYHLDTFLLQAAPFYLKSNYIDLGIRYEIKGIGLHGCLYKELK